MQDLEQPLAERKCAPHNPNNRRIRELSKLARERFPDDTGDYVLPDTPVGQHLAIAIVTHLARAGQRSGKWLAAFCCDRAPWLDPDEIDVTKLQPDRAQELGNKLQLTAALRTKLGITTIAPCDQTPEQRAAARKERRRNSDRDRRRRKREEKGGPTRKQWLAANTVSKLKPWEMEGVSRATYYRRRETGTAASYLSSTVDAQPVSRRNGTAEKTRSSHVERVADTQTSARGVCKRAVSAQCAAVGGGQCVAA
jgi:hypothetical protein